MGCGIAKPSRRNPIDIFIDAKVVQIECNSNELAQLLLPRCSLSYAKVVQIERNSNRYCNIFCDIFRRQGFFILL